MTRPTKIGNLARLACGAALLGLVLIPMRGNGASFVLRGIVVVRADQPQNAVKTESATITDILVHGGVVLWEKAPDTAESQPVVVVPHADYMSGQLLPPVVPNVADLRLTRFAVGTHLSSTPSLLPLSASLWTPLLTQGNASSPQKTELIQRLTEVLGSTAAALGQDGTLTAGQATALASGLSQLAQGAATGGMSRPEAQAALVLLAQNPTAATVTFNFSGLDLRSLSRSTLAAMRLAGGTFYQSQLTGLDLSGFNLAGANLSGQNLDNVHLESANLGGANLSGAVIPRYLGGAILTNANLTGAVLFDSTVMSDLAAPVLLDGANLTGATLGGTNTRVRLQLNGALLEGVQVRGTLVSSGAEAALIRQANLGQATLSGAWDGALFDQVPFAGASITDANFSGVDWHTSQLSGIRLVQQVNLTGAVQPAGAGTKSQFSNQAALIGPQVTWVDGSILDPL